MTAGVHSRDRVAAADVLAVSSALIADDNEANVVLLHRILNHAGMTDIHSTTDPSAVVELFRVTKPDIVMLDLHMPGMDGVAVMDALRRATPPGQYIPILVLTADVTPHARNRVLDAGANDFLTKPVDRTEVVLRVRNLLHTRALHDALAAHNIELEAEIARRSAATARARAERAATVDRIKHAILGDVIDTVFQPIVALRDGAIVGYEALSRFNEPPARPPDEWFNTAAAVGLGIELELAALRRAFGHIEHLPASACLTLNVSPPTTMTAALAALLAPYDATRLVLEITEHAAVDDYDNLVAALAPLRRAGIRVAVDDAGAGFASLHHILRIRPDIIKLDTGLVRDIDQDPVKRALASSLVTFAHDIGATITAEGIETPPEHRVLADLGVPWGQGYLLGRPAPLAAPSR